MNSMYRTWLCMKCGAKGEGGSKVLFEHMLTHDDEEANEKVLAGMAFDPASEQPPVVDGERLYRNMWKRELHLREKYQEQLRVAEEDKEELAEDIETHLDHINRLKQENERLQEKVSWLLELKNTYKKAYAAAITEKDGGRDA